MDADTMQLKYKGFSSWKFDVGTFPRLKWRIKSIAPGIMDADTSQLKKRNFSRWKFYGAALLRRK